jgi:hypothetical protein
MLIALLAWIDVKSGSMVCQRLNMSYVRAPSLASQLSHFFVVNTLILQAPQNPVGAGLPAMAA